MCLLLICNAFTSLAFALYLPYVTHTGGPDNWCAAADRTVSPCSLPCLSWRARDGRHSPGPPRSVRMILMGNFAGVVFGKAMLAMALYVWTRSWWSLGERLLFTCAASASLRPWAAWKAHGCVRQV